MVWHVYGHCIMQILSLCSSWILGRVSVQFSGNFPGSEFCHLVSNEDDHDSKCSAFHDGGGVVVRSGINSSTCAGKYGTVC